MTTTNIKYKKAGNGYTVHVDGTLVGSVLLSGPQSWFFSSSPQPRRQWLGGHTRALAAQALIKRATNPGPKYGTDGRLL